MTQSYTVLILIYKYLQGRRGLDEKGNVIIYFKDASTLPETI